MCGMESSALKVADDIDTNFVAVPFLSFQMTYWGNVVIMSNLLIPPSLLIILFLLKEWKYGSNCR